MLFGVRVKVDPMRKSVSLNDLSQYEQPNANNNNNNGGGDNNESSKVAQDEGYASADDAVQHQSNSGRERKRGEISCPLLLFFVANRRVFMIVFIFHSIRLFLSVLSQLMSTLSEVSIRFIDRFLCYAQIFELYSSILICVAQSQIDSFIT